MMAVSRKNLGLLLAVAAARAVSATLETNLLCNTTLDRANATGFYPFDADFRNIPDPAWAVTVFQSSNLTESTTWFSTGGANYSDDLSLQTDACAQIVRGLPPNMNLLIQDDPGDCSQTLSQQCRKAIIDLLESTAYNLAEYPSPPPYSNLSAGVLPALCNTMFNDLGNDPENVISFPGECSKEFGAASLLSRELVPLTGYNESIMDYGAACTLDGAGRKFYNISTLTADGEKQDKAYDRYSREGQIVLSVYFDVANVDRMSAGNPASAQLRCLRPKKFAKGSRVPPALPKGKPYTYPSVDLSKGAIAGIAVGAVIFLALVVGAAWWFLRRRRRNANKELDGQGKLNERNSTGDSDVKEIDNNGELHELTPVDRKHEADSAQVAEMGGGYWKWIEKPGDEPPRVELAGEGRRAELSA